LSLSEAADSGDRRATLEALRRTLVAAIEAGPAERDLATLSARLMDVLTALEGLVVPEESDKVDDLASARAKRRAAQG
jgi:hypothetical protein